MYKVFASHLRSKTWHRSIPADERRFFRALSQIVQHPAFDETDMGNYMRQSKHLNVANAGDRDCLDAIMHRVSQAGTIRGYLHVISPI